MKNSLQGSLALTRPLTKSATELNITTTANVPLVELLPPTNSTRLHVIAATTICPRLMTPPINAQSALFVRTVQDRRPNPYRKDLASRGLGATSSRSPRHLMVCRLFHVHTSQPFLISVHTFIQGGVGFARSSSWISTAPAGATDVLYLSSFAIFPPPPASNV